MNAYYHLARLYESQGRLELALWAFGRVVDLGRGHPSRVAAEEALQRLGAEPKVSVATDSTVGQ